MYQLLHYQVHSRHVFTTNVRCIILMLVPYEPIHNFLESFSNKITIHKTHVEKQSRHEFYF